MPKTKQKKKSVTKQGFPAKSREKAIHLLFEEKRTLKDVAAQIGCSVNTIQAWKKQFKPADAVESAEPVPKESAKPKASKPQKKKALFRFQVGGELRH